MTITHFCGFYAHSFWDLMRGKKQQFVVPTHPALGKTVPYVLAPGDQWSSLADQDDMLKKAKGGFLYLGIIHNQRKRPLYKRVKSRVLNVVLLCQMGQEKCLIFRDEKRWERRFWS